MPREAGDFVGTELDAADVRGKHGGGSKRWSNPADPLLSQMPVTGELQTQRLGLQASVLTLQRPGAPGQWGITANQHQRPRPAPTEVFRRRRHRAGGVAMGRPKQLPVAITAPTLGCDQLSWIMLKRLRRLTPSRPAQPAAKHSDRAKPSATDQAHQAAGHTPHWARRCANRAQEPSANAHGAPTEVVKRVGAR